MSVSEQVLRSATGAAWRAEAKSRSVDLRRRMDVLMAINNEVTRSIDRHGNEPWSRHELYGILAEEVDELWDNIKNNRPQEEVVAEAIQVAAVIVKYLCGDDRKLGPHPSLE